MKAFHFLSRQFCFIFLLMFSLVQVGWGAGAAAGGVVGAVVPDEEGGLFPDGRLKRIAAIQILPYDPLADATEQGREPIQRKFSLASEDITQEHVDSYHREADDNPLRLRPVGYNAYVFKRSSCGTYKDLFGFGRNCVYYVPAEGEFAKKPDGAPAGAGAGAGGGEDADAPVPDAALPPDPSYYAPKTHGYYLEHLARYKESLKGLKPVKETKSGNPFSTGNYLLVRVDVLVPGSDPKSYIFGTFSSGGANLYEACDLKKHIQPGPLMHLIKEGSFPGAKQWKATKEKEIDGLISKSASETWGYIEPKLLLPADYTYDGKVYPLKLFRVDGRVFPPYAQKLATEDLLEKRFFHQDKLDLTPKDTYEANRKNRKVLLRRLFGETVDSRLLIRKSCTPIKETLDDVNFVYRKVFEQSEQAFLSFLHLTSRETPEHKEARGLHLFALTGGPTGTDKFHANVYLYSTKDICRYCRATLSYRLSCGLFKEHLGNMLKVEGANFTLDNVSLYAFSFDQTDVV
jgi:hypothetical protein